MGEHKVEWEEGELSPIERCEQENFEFYGENGLELVEKRPENGRSSQKREHEEWVVLKLE